MRKIMMLFAFLGLLGMQIFAQKTITGTVTNSDDGSTIPGASVVVKGTTIATVTDINGKYMLNNVPDDAESLVFSYMSMETQEVLISGNVVDCALLAGDVALGDVVVTALGISRDQKSLGYNIQSVGGDDLTRGGGGDLVNSLSGRTSGVQINNSAGTAGASTYITIRGASSISGNNQPLFVIDGMPMDASQSSTGSIYDTEGVTSSSRSIDINPDDIETISVLKGGAATALYGLQAANGVILITTKKGTKNTVSVNIHSSVTSSQISQHIPLQNVYGQGYNGQWLSGYNAAWGPRLDTSSYSTDESVWLNPDYDVEGAIVSANDPLANGSAVKTYDQYDFFQRGLAVDNNVSIAAGSGNSKYYFSVGNLSEKGIIPENIFNRTSVRLNADTKLSDKLSTGGNTMFTNSTGNFIQNGSNLSGVMLGLARTPSTFDNSAGWIFEDGTQRTYRLGGGYDNPYWTAYENAFDDRTNRFVGNAFITYDMADWISATYRAGSDWYNRRYTQIFAVNDRSHPDGLMEERSDFSQIFNSDLFININKKFNDNFGFTMLIGQNMYSSYYKYLSSTANGLSIPNFYDLSNTSAQETNQYTQAYRTAAVFTDINIDVMNMLYFGVALRNEWATTMPEDNLSALYPAFSLGFIFSELIGDNDIIDFGKIRTSWAKTANIASPYSTSSTYDAMSILDGWTNGVSFPFRGATGFETGYLLGNPGLRHETQQTFEVGLEMKLFKDKFGFDVSYFANNNYDLLLAVPIATSTGYNNLYANAASMENKGVEASIYITPIKTDDLYWTISGNFTKFTNTVLELAEGVDDVFLGGFTDPQVRAVAGEEYGTIYGYDWWRDADGNVLINDDPTDDYRDGYPWTCDTAQIPLARVTPDWTANVSSDFNFKGFGFNMLWDIRMGGYMYNGTRFTLHYFGQTEETLNREVVYNDNGTINYDETPAENIVVYNGVYGHVDADGNIVSDGETNVSQVVNDQAWFRGNGSNFGNGPTTSAIEDASWIRLRQVTLSYALSPTIFQNTFISGVEVYATGNNLFLSTPYKGIDPETSLTGARNSQGFDYFNNPGVKSYTFGLKLKF